MGYCGSGEVAGGPGGLEVEAAGDAVDVEDFACEIEVGVGLAFHRFEIEVFQVHSATGDELVFVGALAGDLKLGLGQLSHEVLGLLLSEVSPRLSFGDARGLGKTSPEAAGDSFEEGALHDGTGAMIFAFALQDTFHLLLA